MVNDEGAVGLDCVAVVFDDERVVSDAGIALVATLAGRLGIEGLVGRFVRLPRDRPGAANAGRKVMALIYAMLLGADSIDDCELLRAGRTRRLLGGWLPAPSTLGTFLRAFTFGHVRQLDRAARRDADARLAGGRRPRRRAPRGRCRQLHRRGARLPQAGRGLRLHQAARLPPAARQPGRQRRGAARQAPQGPGDQRARRGALRLRADRPRQARRRQRREAAARRLGVLEPQADRPPGEGRLALFDQRAPAVLGSRRDRQDPRAGLAAARRLPRRRARRRSPRRPPAAGD